jgi:hypothetical protein
LRYLELLFLIVILSIAALLIQPPGNALSKEQIRQHQSDEQLKGIANLVLMYEEVHAGSRPTRLSEIVPSNRSDIITIFYAPSRLQERRPIGWQTNITLLDDSSDYGIASYSNNGILAFERPPLWSDGTVAVCFTNLDVIRTNIADLKKLLKTPEANTNADR